MIRRPPRSTRTDTLFPYTTLFRSIVAQHPRARDISAKAAKPLAERSHGEIDLSGMQAGQAHAARAEHARRMRLVQIEKGVMTSRDLAETGDVRLVAIHAEHAFGDDEAPARRSEARRVGQECVSTCIYRWS